MGINRKRQRDPKEFIAWMHMKQRCLNPKHHAYNHYGGRGITVCERWMVFENFLEDVGKAPSPNLSLDRINNDGNYEPGNVRWATITQQARNKRTRKGITYNGVTMPICGWTQFLGFNRNTLSARLNLGWTIEKAISTPLQDKLKNLVSYKRACAKKLNQGENPDNQK